MINWYNFILKIKPDGKAFRSILNTKIFFEVLAYGFNLVQEYAELTINDQIWYVNDNFDPSQWEPRYEISVPDGATLDERRTIVKSYMLFPQSQNRLSLDYIQRTLNEAGFGTITVNYNSTGTSTGILRMNDFGDEKNTFTLGAFSYNTFRLTGDVNISYYYSAILLVMSLMPLQVGVYDNLSVNSAVALDDDYAIATDTTHTLTITVV